MLDRIKTYVGGPPVVPGPAGATAPHPQGPKCDACGMRGGVNKGLVKVENEVLTLCVDSCACSDRVRADELAMIAMSGSL